MGNKVIIGIFFCSSWLLQACDLPVGTTATPPSDDEMRAQLSTQIEYLDNHKLSIDACTFPNQRHTLLVQACLYGFEDITKRLLDLGAVSLKPDEFFGSAIGAAVTGEHVSIVKLLLERDKYAVDDMGLHKLPLLSSIFATPVKSKEKRKELIKLLIMHGAACNIRDQHQAKTAIEIAQECDPESAILIKELAAKKAN